jgi:hypothetical protein
MWREPLHHYDDPPDRTTTPRAPDASRAAEKRHANALVIGTILVLAVIAGLVLVL